MEKLSKSANNNQIYYGKILAPHGIKGYVKVQVLTDFPEQFMKGKKIELFNESTGKSSLQVIEEYKISSNRYLIKLIGIDNRNNAAILSGRYFVKKRESARTISDENKFYTFEVVGLRVMTETGEVGTVKNVIFDKDSQNYLIIETEGDDILIPFKKEFVADIDIEGGLLNLKNLEGFFDVEN
ncbi:16S rRNA processing protein RimM [bacterium]|nr:16S rRNA processing protein RimM [bacterium]